jgi:hypothetical protein
MIELYHNDMPGVCGEGATGLAEKSSSGKAITSGSKNLADFPGICF